MEEFALSTSLVILPVAFVPGWINPDHLARSVA